MSASVGRAQMVELVSSCMAQGMNAEQLTDALFEVLSSDERWAKAFGHRLRGGILELLQRDGELSPVQASEEMDVSLGSLSYHFKLLQRLGVIELVREVQRRGAVEHVYRLADGG